MTSLLRENYFLTINTSRGFKRLPGESCRKELLMRFDVILPISVVVNKMFIVNVIPYHSRMDTKSETVHRRKILHSKHEINKRIALNLYRMDS